MKRTRINWKIAAVSGTLAGVGLATVIVLNVIFW